MTRKSWRSWTSWRNSKNCWNWKNQRSSGQAQVRSEALPETETRRQSQPEAAYCLVRRNRKQELSRLPEPTPEQALPETETRLPAPEQPA